MSRTSRRRTAATAGAAGTTRLDRRRRKAMVALLAAGIVSLTAAGFAMVLAVASARSGMVASHRAQTLALMCVVAVIVTLAIATWQRRELAREQSKLQKQVGFTTALDAQNRRLEAVVDLARRVAATHDSGEVSAKLATTVGQLTRADGCAVFLYEGHRLVLSAAAGSVAFAGADRDGLFARVLNTAQPVRQRMPASVIARGEIGAMETLMVPIAPNGRPTGVLIAVRMTPEPFNRQDEHVAELGAAVAGTPLEAARVIDLTKELARVDPLTELGNRRRLNEDLPRAVTELTRRQRPLSFLMIDIDHFKSYNDTYGHAAGDDALRLVASAVVSAVHADDGVYRYGGEEISVLLRDCDAATAAAIAETIRVRVSALDTGPGRRCLSVSIGVASTADGFRSPNELLMAADVSLYEAKRGGRNQVAVAGSGARAAAFN